MPSKFSNLSQRFKKKIRRSADGESIAESQRSASSSTQLAAAGRSSPDPLSIQTQDERPPGRSLPSFDENVDPTSRAKDTEIPLIVAEPLEEQQIVIPSPPIHALESPAEEKPPAESPLLAPEKEQAILPEESEPEDKCTLGQPSSTDDVSVSEAHQQPEIPAAAPSEPEPNPAHDSSGDSLPLPAAEQQELSPEATEPVSEDSPPVAEVLLPAPALPTPAVKTSDTPEEPATVLEHVPPPEPVSPTDSLQTSEDALIAGDKQDIAEEHDDIDGQDQSPSGGTSPEDELQQVALSDSENQDVENPQSTPSIRDSLSEADFLLEPQTPASETTEPAHRERFLAKLGRFFVSDATFVLDSSPEGKGSRCMNGTQARTLKTIQDWLYDNTAETVLWLSSPGGTGKSTIARTVAASLALRTASADGRRGPANIHLGASFFFSQGDAERNNTRKFLPTIAGCLASGPAQLSASIADAFGKIKKLEWKDSATEWQSLIIDPLSEFESKLQSSLTLVIIVDALDECEAADRGRTTEGIHRIVRLLGRAQNPSWTYLKLKILVTSRPERHIKEAFNYLPRDRIREQALGAVTVVDQEGEPVLKNDIALFLRKELAQISRNQVSSSKEWPGEDRLRKLSELSEGLFIYAVVCSRHLNVPVAEEREERLRELLDGKTDQHLVTSQNNLDLLYTKVLNCSTKRWTDGDRERLRNAIGSIMVLYRPVSIYTLASLLPGPHREMRKPQLLHDRLADLGSVIHAPRDETPITLLHSSLRNLLLDKGSCPGLFWVDSQQMHRNQFERCLEILRANLKEQDICQVRLPACPTAQLSTSDVEQHIPPYLQYACLHWVDHIALLELDAGIIAKVYEFFRTKLLYWLEALSWLRQVPAAISMVLKVRHILAAIDSTAPEGSSPGHEQLAGLVIDAHRFLVGNRYIIESAPLQVYSSALMFSPSRSTVRELYAKTQIPRWVKLLPRASSRWGPELFMLEGQVEEVTDGKSSPTSSIRPQNENEMVRQIEISWRRDHILSTSVTGTMKLWHAATGTIKLGHLPFDDAAFSRDGRYVWMRDSQSLRVWVCDLIKRDIDPFEAHGCFAAAFSNDNKLVALMCHGDIKLLSLETMTVLEHLSLLDSIYELPREFFFLGAVSTRVVAWVMEHPQYDVAVMHISNLATGQHLAQYECVLSHENLVVSPEGRFFALRQMSGDWRLRVTDAVGSEAELSANVSSEDDSVEPLFVCFSPDNQFVAVTELLDGDANFATSVWQCRFGTRKYQVALGSERPKSVQFSADGNALVVVSPRDTVSMRDLKTGRDLGEVSLGLPETKTIRGVSDKCVHVDTDWGCRPLPAPLLKSSLSKMAVSGLGCPHVWMRGDGWLAQGSEDLLWLPKALRPTIVAMRDGLVVLGGQDGSLKFLEIDHERTPVAPEIRQERYAFQGYE